MKTNSILIILVVFCFGIVRAQEPITSELHTTFLKLDAAAFDEGFNKCNLDLLETLLTEDLEFYHDVAGNQNKKEFMEAMRKNICGFAERKPIRKLVPNTLKVFPMYDNGTLYAAIVEGKHEFHIQEPGKELYQTGDALFSGLWIKDGDSWKMKRIFSYHHRGVE